MNTEPVANRCPKCQAPLPANAPQGLCPKCLLAAAATPTEAGQPPGKDPPLETVTAAFPQLEIIGLIGQGGMGVVYKARQPKLDRFVALKLLPEALAADPAFAERFNREARLLARLNHPNIVTVHDFGQSGGFFYLLMELVDGVNLRQAMHAGRFTPQQAMLLVPKICEALQFAHDEGILHRDIKPENILLDTRGRVKIADFGIAKLLGEAREQLTLTASGMAVGTPHYMAPEQLEHPHDIDQRADIYSLGVVFYEMLTGELPIGRFAPPSTKSTVDPRVDDIVFHALEKEREKRFRSATEVKTSVEAISSTTIPPANPAAGSSETRAVCYFNTPQRMRDCFPSAAARIFTSKGELVLEPENLTFISPWRTTIRIPLKDIQDLSISQFQMWTTPWVMKYARLNFLSVSFRRDGQLETVHLTPVPPGAVAAGQINDYVGGWFEHLQQAIRQRTGATPAVTHPDALTVSAEPAWNRKGLPLAFGFMLTWLATWLLMPQHNFPKPIWLALLLTSIPLLTGTVWFVFGFLRANRALWRGQLDAVTSDEPPAAEPAGPSGTGSAPSQRRRSRLFNSSSLGVLAVVLVVPLLLLLWGLGAWLFPSVGEKLFGNHSASQAVIGTISPVSEGSQPAPAFARWQFKCLVPPNHLAHILFVRWDKGVPVIEPRFSAYFKTRNMPIDAPVAISCDPRDESPAPAATNAVQWNVDLGFGYTSSGLLPAQPPYRKAETPFRMTIRSGHQRVIPLVDYVEQKGGASQNQPGVQLRIFLEPLESPANRTVPTELDRLGFVAGPGLAGTMEEALKMLQQRPADK